ncbi:recombinase RecT [Paenibacillus sp. L3-i20]|uniref:recombinase RecT n=1 Tax=Paenibacillus sp. L3-i20 TaxID=2905833 RepID=UPI001EDFF6EA|nr:recombinase RecT [Paenibacillus sp. L3-i20]GKU79815.1 DNA recombination protein RecT [Paenibacillus sp. L3-i20]
MAGAVDQTIIKNQLAQATGNVPEKKEKTVFDLIKTLEGEFARALPEQVGVQRFVRIATTIVRTNPKLMQCDQMSIIAALMQSAQLGLEPNTPLGQAYLIPSKNKRVIDGKEKWIDEARFEIGYKGLIELALRTDKYKAIYAHEVYINDKFDFKYGLFKDLIHVPADEPEGDPIKYYAVYHLHNGGSDFVVWSTDRIEKHSQQYSQAVKKGHSSPWKTDFPGMAKKTVLKEALKYAPKSTEFARQLSADGTIKREVPENVDMSEVIDVTDWSAEYVDVAEDGQE